MVTSSEGALGMQGTPSSAGAILPWNVSVGWSGQMIFTDDAPMMDSHILINKHQPDPLCTGRCGIALTGIMGTRSVRPKSHAGAR